MNAEEARMITERNLKGSLIDPLLEVAYSRIKEFAKKGEYRVVHPFYGVKGFPSMAIQESAANNLRLDGFTVKLIPNPEPEGPRSSEYWEVSW